MGKPSDIFLNRASEHKGTSNLMGKCIKSAQKSAISYHFLQRVSPMTFDDFDILASDSNKFMLLAKDNLPIKRDEPVLNRTTKSLQPDLCDKA